MVVLDWFEYHCLPFFKFVVLADGYAVGKITITPSALPHDQIVANNMPTSLPAVVSIKYWGVRIIYIMDGFLIRWNKRHRRFKYVTRYW